MNEKKLAGKVALITGGARGLGRGYTLRLAGLGADIAIIDRNLKAAEVYEFEMKQMTAPTVMDECKALGVRAMGLEVDLTDRSATEKAVADIVDKMGRIDILVNCAGIGTKPTPLEDTAEEEWDRVMDVNCKGTFLTIQAITPHMKENKSGRIILIG